VTFEDWWPTAFYHTTEEAARQAWEAATYAASSRAGDASNEAEKDARRKVAVKALADFYNTDIQSMAEFNEQVNAIIKAAQG
jgi:hypothetical protein